MYETEKGTIKLKCPREQEYVSWQFKIYDRTYMQLTAFLQYVARLCILSIWYQYCSQITQVLESTYPLYLCFGFFIVSGFYFRYDLLEHVTYTHWIIALPPMKPPLSLMKTQKWSPSSSLKAHTWCPTKHPKWLVSWINSSKQFRSFFSLTLFSLLVPHIMKTIDRVHKEKQTAADSNFQKSKL